MDKPMSLAEARAAWEVARMTSNPMAEALAARDYMLRIMAASMLGDMSEAERVAALEAIAASIRKHIPEEVAAIGEALVKMGVPLEVATQVASMAWNERDKGGALGEFQIVSVDSEGVASVLDITPDHPADGIGRPIGNA